MKSITLSELEDELDRSPEDWSLRLRLIEGHILEEDIDTARRLVRDSPGEAPLPPELQYRLHSAMTQGAAAVERFYASEEGVKVPFLREVSEPAGQDSSSEGEAEAEAEAGVTDNDGDPEVDDPVDAGLEFSAEEDNQLDSDDLEEGGESAGEVDSKESGESTADQESVDEQKEEKGGKEDEKTVAGIKNQGPTEKVAVKASDDSADGKGARKEADEKPPLMVLPKPKPVGESDRFAYSDDDDEDFEHLLIPPERESQGVPKVSAFTMALIIHLALVVLCGALVISMPRTEPPQIVAVNVNAERDPVIAPRLVERNTPKAASASAQPAPLITTTASTNFSVPEFDIDAVPDVTVMMAGLDAGQGMSFKGTGRESNVNFFGIKSGGKRIAFIVDATKYMLVDNKGGMFAYDKVKAEVGAMLSQLNRGTAFNIILYEGGTLSLFREEPVAAKPSTVRLAIEWLDPLNRNYDALGLGRNIATRGSVNSGVGIVEARDIHSYPKAIQAALEMDVNAVFAICSGYRGISRSLTAEQVAEVRKMNEGRTPGTVDPKDRARWSEAVAKTREWLQKENAARAEKGLAPKVVINFNSLVRQVTGATPPRATGGSPAPAGMPRPGPPYTQDEVEDHFIEVVKHYYKEENKAVPEIHMVVFLGEDEDIGDNKDHFRRLTRKNKGKLKILKGLAALTDVTSK